MATLPSVEIQLLEYQAILTNAGMGIVMTRDRLIYRCNRYIAEMFGWTEEELTGQPGSIFYPSEDAYNALGAKAYPILSAGQTLDVEVDLAHRDGHLMPVHLVARAIDPANIGAGTVWMARDLTQERARKRDEERLLREYALIFDNAMIGIAFQRKRSFLRCNRRVEEIFGFAPGAMIGKTTRILFNSDTAWEETGRYVYSTDTTHFDGDVRYCRTDGTPIWVRIIGRTIEGGDVDGEKTWVWVYDDITEQHELAESLRHNNEALESRVAERTAELSRLTEELAGQRHFLERLIEAIPGPLFYKDAQGRYLGHNKEFEAFIGVPSNELIGRTVFDISPPDLAEKYAKADQALIDNPGRQVYEAQVLDHSGVRRDVMFHKATFDAADGKVGGLIGMMLDITALKSAQNKLDFQAHHDSLTGLPNRTLLEDRLHQALQRARREGNRVALLFVDLDRFKNINDNLGHHIGDQVLSEAASRLAESVREADTVGRFGGDEFVIIAEQLPDQRAAAGIAAKILDRIAEPIYIDGQELFIGASIGISLYPKDGDDAQTLLKHADAAMYTAKERGRNSYEFVSSELAEFSLSRFQLEVGIRHAIERDEFVVYYQPQFSLITGKLSGAEALLRWNHPERGLIPPGDFIPLAEESGLIVPIGEWVLRAACRQWAKWHADAPDGEFPLLAVNVSGVEFRRGEVAASVRSALADSQLPPALLELEITESALMHQADGGARSLGVLRDMGISLAIDDFGTGYSSLAYLKRLPLSKLKIDRNFVRDLPDDTEDAAISRAVIAMAHNLGLTVLAEGVENVAQSDFLAAEGCDEMQGFLRGRPIPAEEFFAHHLAPRIP